MNKRVLAFLLIVACIILSLIIFKTPMLKILYPRKYSDIVEEYAKKYEVEDNLIYAVIKAESNFNEKAVSNKKAIGLMQIMEKTAKEIATTCDIEINENDNAREKIAEVQNNINIGTKYLSNLLEKYNNIEVAIAAYNAGTGNVDKWIEEGIIKQDGTNIENVPYKETNNYVRKTLANYNLYKQLY